MLIQNVVTDQIDSAQSSLHFVAFTYTELTYEVCRRYLFKLNIDSPSVASRYVTRK